MGRKFKYWGREEKQGLPGIRMHALTANGKPHKETLIDFGPWRTGRGDEIIKALLKEKHHNILVDFSEKEMRRMFGRPKNEVVRAFLSGIIGTEFYMIAMVLIACKLRRKYGELVEVRCLDDPQRIELIYERGHGFTITEHSGHPDITMIKFGYRGTGPDCFYAFLNEAGFNISLEQIADIKPPHTLYKKSGKQK